jgi:hypothetical protein
VVTADGLDSLPADELDSLEASLLAEEELVDASEPVVGALVVDVPVPLELVDVLLADDSLDEAGCLAAAPFVAEVVTVRPLAVEAVSFVESAGSCPEASCTYTARNAAANSAAVSPAMPRRMRCTRRRIAERRLRASDRPSSGRRFGCGVAGDVSRGSMVAPIGVSDCVRTSLRGACPSSVQRG